STRGNLYIAPELPGITLSDDGYRQELDENSDSIIISTESSDNEVDENRVEISNISNVQRSSSGINRIQTSATNSLQFLITNTDSAGIQEIRNEDLRVQK